MTQYSRGRNFEYKVRKKWESDGFWVMRSAGSKGKVDLIAIKSVFYTDYGTSMRELRPDVFLIQCKIGGITQREREALQLLALDLGCKAVVAYTEGRGHYDEEYL